MTPSKADATLTPIRDNSSLELARSGISRASTETIKSDAAEASGKRQPRKLTKSRNSSEVAADKEKPKAVLQKKNGAARNSLNGTEGHQGPNSNSQ